VPPSVAGLLASASSARGWLPARWRRPRPRPRPPPSVAAVVVVAEAVIAAGQVLKRGTSTRSSGGTGREECLRAALGVASLWRGPGNGGLSDKGEDERAMLAVGAVGR
jgi:hypothetical protein